MKATRNSDRLREILYATRHQIVSLKDIQMDMMRHDAKVANSIGRGLQASTNACQSGRKRRAKTQWLVLWSYQNQRRPPRQHHGLNKSP